MVHNDYSVLSNEKLELYRETKWRHKKRWRTKMADPLKRGVIIE